MWIRNCVVMVSLAIGMLMGCAKSGQLETVDVAGKLTVDGKPLGPVLLVLTSQDKNLPAVTGYVKDDGTFKLQTYKENDGAPVGTYKVTLSADPMSPGLVPAIKDATLDVKKPASGSQLAVELKLEATSGGGMVSPLGQPGQEGGSARPGGGVFPGTDAAGAGATTAEDTKK